MSARRPPVVVLAVGAVLGSLTWAVWLGWDRTASYDVVTGTIEKPYVTLQVFGCALTLAVVTAVLAARWHSPAAAAGVGLGFWLVWTVDASARDASGLYAVGSLMLALGLAAGTAMAALVGAGIGNAITRRRASREASGSPEVGGR